MADEHSLHESKLSRWTGYIAGMVVLATILATPWFNGSYSFQAQEVVSRAASLALVLTAVSLCFQRRRQRMPSCLLLVLGAMLLGCLQTIPLPHTLASQLSTEAAALRTEFDGSTPQLTTLSVGSTLTRRQLALFSVGASFFFVGIVLFRRREQLKWLFWAITANGAALGLWGIIQKTSRQNEILPGIAAPDYGLYFSSYINHSSAAGYLNMCLGGSIGLLILYLSKHRRTVRRSRGHESSGQPNPADTAFSRVCQQLLKPHTLTVCVLTGAIVAGVAFSLSRGGWFSAGIAFVVVLMSLNRAVPLRFLLLLALLAGGCASLFVFNSGQLEGLEQRVSTLELDRTLENGRLGHWKDGFATAQKFLATGSGLGTYGYVYLTNEQNNKNAWFDHAHNQYLETLVDAGIPGLLLLLAALTMVACAIGRNLRDERRFWVGSAIAFVFASQVTHAFSDFGLYMSANMCLLAVLCGAAFGDAFASSPETKFDWLRMPHWLSRPLVWTFALFACCLLSTRELQVAKAVESALAATAQNSDDIRSSLNLNEVNADLSQLETVARLAPADPHLRLRMAEKRIRRFRLLHVSRAIESNPELDVDLAWKSTSPLAVHGRLVKLSQEQLKHLAVVNRSDPFFQQNLKTAVSDLTHSRKSLPFLPRVHTYLAMMAPRFEEKTSTHVQRARRLSYANARHRFTCGALEMNTQNPDNMCADWHRVLELGASDYEARIFNAGLQTVGVERLVRDILPADATALVDIARRYRPKLEFQSSVATTSSSLALLPLPEINATAQNFTDEILNRALVILETEAAQSSGEGSEESADRAWLRGSILSQRGRHSEAAVHLEDAVTLRPSNIEWRFVLALTLRTLGRTPDARKHAQWCARMQPSERRYRNLLKQLDSEIYELNPATKSRTSYRRHSMLNQPATTGLPTTSVNKLSEDQFSTASRLSP